jgi:hypothetical protein
MENPSPTSVSGRDAPPPLDLQAQSSRSWWWQMVALGSTSIICFPLSFPLLGSDSESEHASDSEAFNSATSDCLARHSLVL